MDFIQAKESYRFSSDALLLADFASTHLAKNIFDKKRGISPPFLFLDLGCGCGVIGIEILKYVSKHYPDYIKDTYILGIDKEHALLESARANAKSFGFYENYHAICADIAPNTPSTYDEPSTLNIVATPGIFDRVDTLVQNWAFEKIEAQRGKKADAHAAASVAHADASAVAHASVSKNPRLFDAVITNPPWYDVSKGKVSHGILRRNALFGDETTMETFLGFAGKRLKKNGSLYVVGKSANFHDCMKAMPASLRCTTMQNVHARQEDDAVFFLLEARFQSKASMVFPSPLFLNTKVF